MNKLIGTKVFTTFNKRVEVSPGRFEHKADKQGPFEVIDVQAVGTEGEGYFLFLLQDGLRVRSVSESMIEIATPLGKALHE